MWPTKVHKDFRFTRTPRKTSFRENLPQLGQPQQPRNHSSNREHRGTGPPAGLVLYPAVPFFSTTPINKATYEPRARLRSTGPPSEAHVFFRLLEATEEHYPARQAVRQVTVSSPLTLRLSYPPPVTRSKLVLHRLHEHQSVAVGRTSGRDYTY